MTDSTASRTNRRASVPAWVQEQRKTKAAAKRIRRAAKPGASTYARGNVR